MPTPPRRRPVDAQSVLRGVGEVAESDARGPVSEAYTRLRSIIGVAFVPTVYRMLAPWDRYLVAAVDATAPTLAAPAAARFCEQAPAMSAGLGMERVPPGALGGSAGAEAHAVLARYRVANPRNLVFALAARDGLLTAGAAGGDPGTGEPDPEDALTAGIRARHGGIVPGVWRELARWPALRSRGWPLVEAVMATPEWARARDAVRARAADLARAAAVPSPEDLGYGRDDAAAIASILERFSAVIPAMILEVEVLARALGPARS